MNVVRSLFPLSPVRWVHLDPLVGPGFEPARRNAAARKHKGVRPLGVDHRQFQIGAVWRGLNRLPFHRRSWAAYGHRALIFIKPPARRAGRGATLISADEPILLGRPLARRWRLDRLSVRERLHHRDPRHHDQPALLGRARQAFHRQLPVRLLALGLRQAHHVVRRIAHVKRTLPLASMRGSSNSVDQDMMMVGGDYSRKLTGNIGR